MYNLVDKLRQIYKNIHLDYLILSEIKLQEINQIPFNNPVEIRKLLVAFTSYVMIKLGIQSLLYFGNHNICINQVRVRGTIKTKL